MAGGGILGKRIAGKGMQGLWLSTDGPYRPRPPNRIATNSVVAHRAHTIALPAIRLPHLPTLGQQAWSSVPVSLVRHGQRNESAQRTVGRSSGEIGDEGGHIIARMFDGPGEGRLHMVPQGRKLNRDAGSQWTAMEREWKAHLTRGDKVYVNIQIDWPPGAKRPNEFNVMYEITDSVTGAKQLRMRAFSNPTL